MLNLKTSCRVSPTNKVLGMIFNCITSLCSWLPNYLSPLTRNKISAPLSVSWADPSLLCIPHQQSVIKPLVSSILQSSPASVLCIFVAQALSQLRPSPSPQFLPFMAGALPGSACQWNICDVDSIPGSGGSPGIGNGNPLQYSCWENPMDRGAWWITVHGVAKSWTLLRTGWYSSLTQVLPVSLSF